MSQGKSLQSFLLTL